MSCRRTANPLQGLAGRDPAKTSVEPVPDPRCQRSPPSRRHRREWSPLISTLRPTGPPEVGRRGRAPVRDQREQHLPAADRGAGLSSRRSAAPIPSRAHIASSAQVPPTGRERKTPAPHRPGRPARLSGPGAGDRRDQTPQRRPVRASRRSEDDRTLTARGRVHVVGQPSGPRRRCPLRPPQEHGPRTLPRDPTPSANRRQA